MSAICCIFNFAPHYRQVIYEKMDDELNCHFYFGDKVPGSLKAMNPKTLKGFQGYFKNFIYKNHIIYQYGILTLLLKNYDNYILTVDKASLTSWFFIYLAKLLNKNVFFWTHGCYGNESFFGRLINKIFFLPSSGLFLYGDYANEKLRSLGFSTSKLHTIGNSLNYDLHLSIRKSLKRNDVFMEHFKNDNPVIIFIGRLEKGKKLEMLIETLALLAQEKEYYNCVFVGDGTDLNNLKKMSKSLSLSENVWFYGACYDDKEIASLIYNASICVSPGNVGLTAIHSLSFGTPVITHNNFMEQMPEFEAIIEGWNGSFFVQNNVRSLKKTIKVWMKNHPEKTQTLIENCFSIIDQKYNPYVQLEVLKKVLND